MLNMTLQYNLVELFMFGFIKNTIQMEKIVLAEK
jgi:hypothetical protein